MTSSNIVTDQYFTTKSDVEIKYFQSCVRPVRRVRETVATHALKEFRCLQTVTQKENGILIRRISILIWSKNAYINMLKVAY